MTYNLTAATAEYQTRDILALSFAAYRRNQKYIKETRVVDGNRVWSNKELMHYTLAVAKNAADTEFQRNWIPENFVPLETVDEDYENADNAISFFKRYTLDAIGDTLTSFKNDVLSVVSEPRMSSFKIGIVAYIPELYERENKDVKLKRRLKKDFSESQYYVGKVSGVVEILKSFKINKFDKYAHLGAIDGNLVSFMSRNCYEVGKFYNITAKFSAKDVCEMTGVPKSRISYVKMKKA